MKRMLLLFSLLVVTLITSVNAATVLNATQVVTVSISNSTLSLTGGYIFGNIKIPDPSMVSFSDSINFTQSCVNVTVVNSTNSTLNTTSIVCSFDGNYSKEIPINFGAGVTATTTDQSADYKTCIDDKAALNAGLNACVTAKNEQGQFKENYTACSTNLQICTSDKATLQKDKDAITQDFNDSKNAKLYWGGIGLVLGFLIRMVMKGEIGGAKPKKAEDSFNRNQAG